MADDALRMGAAVELGRCVYMMSRFQEARAACSMALDLAAALGDRPSLARARGELGNVLTALGRTQDAMRQHETYIEAGVISSLAEVARDAGDMAAAERGLRTALELRRKMGQRDGEADCLRALGEVLVRMDRQDEARPVLEQAIALARDVGVESTQLLASAWLATLPEGDRTAALEALQRGSGRIDMALVMQSNFVVWQAVHDPSHLAEAKRLHDFLVEHAPEECRESMLANVRLHREIMDAWNRHGGSAGTSASDSASAT